MNVTLSNGESLYLPDSTSARAVEVITNWSVPSYDEALAQWGEQATAKLYEAVEAAIMPNHIANRNRGGFALGDDYDSSAYHAASAFANTVASRHWHPHLSLGAEGSVEGAINSLFVDYYGSYFPLTVGGVHPEIGAIVRGLSMAEPEQAAEVNGLFDNFPREPHGRMVRNDEPKWEGDGDWVDTELSKAELIYLSGGYGYEGLFRLPGTNTFYMVITDGESGCWVCNRFVGKPA